MPIFNNGKCFYVYIENRATIFFEENRLEISFHMGRKWLNFKWTDFLRFVSSLNHTGFNFHYTTIYMHYTIIYGVYPLSVHRTMH